MWKVLAVFLVAAVTLAIGLTVARTVGFDPEPAKAPDGVLEAGQPSLGGDEDWDAFEAQRRAAAAAAARAAAQTPDTPPTVRAPQMDLPIPTSPTSAPETDAQ